MNHVRAAVDIVYLDAGGGHRSVAEAVSAVLRHGRPSWQPRLVSLQHLLDPLDLGRRTCGLRLEDLYNLMLRRGWTLGATLGLRVLQALIRLYHAAIVRTLEAAWRQRTPALLVSVVPNFNRALGESLGRARPGAPFVTLLTDLADCPPHFWIETGSQYFICPSPKARDQALAIGHPRERVFLTSGLVIHPRFYDETPVDRPRERRRLGLDPDRPTGLVLFGAQGAAAIASVVRRLDRSGLDLQLIVLCGHNETVARRLRASGSRLPLVVESHTHDVPSYMRLADFFIGKPGSISVSEALLIGLPLIVERSAWTLPQERYTAAWIDVNGLGLVVPSFRQVGAAVRVLLEPVRFAECQRRVAGVRSQAVFEIPGLLERILAATGPSLETISGGPGAPAPVPTVSAGGGR